MTKKDSSFKIALFFFACVSFLYMNPSFAQIETVFSPLPSLIPEGDTVIFTGILRINEEPLSNQLVIITDETAKEPIAEVLTDSKGQFRFEWKATLGKHIFYIQSESSRIVFRSDPYTVTVLPRSEPIDDAPAGYVPPEPIDDAPTDYVTPELIDERPTGYVPPESSYEPAYQNFKYDYLLLLLVIPIAVVAVYVVQKNRAVKPPIPSVELRGGLEK